MAPNNHKIDKNILKHALTLFKLLNGPYFSIEFASLNVNKVLTSRQSQFQIIKTHRLKIGANALSNRLYVLMEKYPLIGLI
jgi:hypothetical protein